jgi:phage tail-like protein
MPFKEDQSAPAIWFELDIQGHPVGYFQEITGLSAEVETLAYSEGGMNEFQHKLPTRVKYPNLVLKRGMTTKSDLQKWFQKSHVKAERTGIRLSMLDQEGTRIRTWSFVNAFPIKWTGPNFNATQSTLAIEAIEISHEGIEDVT